MTVAEKFPEKDLGVSFVPENDTVFRLAQLLLLLEALDRESRPGAALERLAYYDFFSANPYLVISRDDDEHSQLVMAGFDDRSLSYASSGQRFTSRRERLQHDLGLLVAYGLASATVQGGAVIYTITRAGSNLAARFTALYARSYLVSAAVVVRRLRRLSDTKLRENARAWLRPEHASFPDAILDLFDAPDEATAVTVDQGTVDG